ncbi:uncharacterized protein [Panulirus ornatus]|uniref:uncharacterized protein isoform X2 n=1 Tax=Panulirus ornatus TaxID=150431 RepID=UPI003A889FB3
MITKIHLRMDGVRRTLTLLSTAAVVSTLAVNGLQLPHHHHQQQHGGVVWYPSVLPGAQQLPILPHASQQPLLYQYVVLPALHLQWRRNGTHHSASRHVPTTSPDGRCSSSSHDDRYHHSLHDERHPHSSHDERHPHASDDVRHPLSSHDERHPQSSQDEQYPHFSQEQYPHSPQDEYPPSSQVQHPHFSIEQYPHSSQDEQRPHSSQDEQHFLMSLPSDEYDFKIGPPVLQGHDDHFTTMSSVSDASDQLNPGRHYDLSKLSFAAKEQLKSVGSLEELLQVPGVSQLLKDDDAQENLEAWTTEKPQSHRSSRMYRKRGERRREEHMPNAGCEVEKVSVMLKARPGTRLFPPCVRVGRCGGCCSPGRTCSPTSVNMRSFKAFELSIDLRESRSVKQKVEEAVGCHCECQVRASDCDLAIQDYDPDACMCVCKSSLEEEQARCEASPEHHWHPYRCACICADVGSRECSSGHTFYEDTCRCEATRQE